jgi:preprotein translocase subunit SecY
MRPVVFVIVMVSLLILFSIHWIEITRTVDKTSVMFQNKFSEIYYKIRG